jgi:excinuclease Cho
VEQSDDWKQTHVIDHWFYVGTLEHGKSGPMPKPARKRVFDVDTYKILVKPMLQGELRIVPVKSGR